MNELLGLAVSAHGGLERWSRVRSIDVSLIISGQLLEVKGFPEHQHTKVTSDGLLKRMDYTTDVLGGVASHYLYDPKNFAGLVVPTRRRVVQRTPAGPKVTGITAVFLDYLDVKIHDR